MYSTVSLIFVLVLQIRWLSRDFYVPVNTVSAFKLLSKSNRNRAKWHTRTDKRNWQLSCRGIKLFPISPDADARGYSLQAIIDSLHGFFFFFFFFFFHLKLCKLKLLKTYIVVWQILIGHFQRVNWLLFCVEHSCRKLHVFNSNRNPMF